jgi:hypothetical protein
MENTIPALIKQLKVTAASIATSVATLNEEEEDDETTEATTPSPEQILAKLLESLNASDGGLKDYIKDL